MFKIDEYAKVIESGEVGEIMDVRGDHVTLFLRSMADCQPEGTVFDMCELVPATIPKVKSSQLGPFVRGEISIEEITAGTGFVLSELVMDSEPYRITAADFLAGVRVYAKKPAKTACIWLEILLRDLEDYILPHETDRIIRDEVTEKDIINRAVDLAFGLLWLLDWQYQCEISEKEWEPLEELLSKWVESDGKEYSDYFRHKIVNQFDEDSIDSESEKTQRLFKECLDYLCDEKKDKEAIRKRGYCYYCGTKVYPNDWVKARDSFIDYYNMTGDASAANTLGYIYYYGRCNGGIPQYEEAFKYFSIGHAYSYFESTYKLADMLSHGYGVVKDVDSANHLYWSVYNENVKRFRKGEVTGKFADAALRIGNCFRDEIGERKSARIAYHYYLQADLAIRARIKAANCYGDNSVFTGIQNAMKEVRTEYTEYRRTRKFWGTEWTNWVLLGHRRCKATVKELKNGVLSLRFSPMKRYDENKAPMMLITVEEADYCELKKKINI
ncbi:MAG: hypothetical protein MJ171_05580, partial [Clostridia bacterium]|nr:hypothetical protein [Clostridia bacterium]